MTVDLDRSARRAVTGLWPWREKPGAREAIRIVIQDWRKHIKKAQGSR